MAEQADALGLEPSTPQGAWGSESPSRYQVRPADVSELADEQRSERCVGNHVEVRVLSSAPGFAVVLEMADGRASEARVGDHVEVRCLSAAPRLAAVAEQADAHGPNPCAVKGVGVRLPLRHQDITGMSENRTAGCNSLRRGGRAA